MTSVLIVVPARSGSVRIPRKNLKTIEGIPLVARAMEDALGAARLLALEDIGTDCVVSTDDEEFACGYPWVPRPSKIAGGHRDSLRDVVRHALQYEEFERRQVYDYVVTLQPAVPVRTPDIISQMVSEVIRHKCKGGITAVPIVPWIWNRDGDKAYNGWTPDPYPLSQELKRQYWQEINSVQIADRETASAGKRWDLPLLVHYLPPYAAVDIDDQEDLDRAEMVLPAMIEWLKVDNGDSVVLRSINDVRSIP